MSLFNLFRKKPVEAAPQHAVLVVLNSAELSDEICEENDVSSLEDELARAIEQQGAGELDGNEIGPLETVIYTYGPNADRLFSAMEDVLNTHPLCRKARVVLRAGAPGAPERVLQVQDL